MNDFPRRTFHVNVVQLLLVFAGADADVADVDVADVDVADADVVPKLEGKMFPGLTNLEGTNQCFQVCPTSGVWPWPDPCSTEPEDGPRQDITAE